MIGSQSQGILNFSVRCSGKFSGREDSMVRGLEGTSRSGVQDVYVPTGVCRNLLE